MIFHFKLHKTIQAVAVLLRLEHADRMNYMRLSKLLYLADRKCLEDRGVPITGDSFVAMRRGPVLSRVYDLIRGQHTDAGKWEDHLRTDNYELELLSDPGRGELSKYEVNKLKQISKEFRDKDEFAMVDFTHQLPEWIKNDPGNSSKMIPLEDILEAVGRLGDIDSIKQDARDSTIYDSLFGA